MIPDPTCCTHSPHWCGFEITRRKRQVSPPRHRDMLDNTAPSVNKTGIVVVFTGHKQIPSIAACCPCLAFPGSLPGEEMLPLSRTNVLHRGRQNTTHIIRLLGARNPWCDDLAWIFQCMASPYYQCRCHRDTSR